MFTPAILMVITTRLTLLGIIMLCQHLLFQYHQLQGFGILIFILFLIVAVWMVDILISTIQLLLAMADLCPLFFQALCLVVRHFLLFCLLWPLCLLWLLYSLQLFSLQLLVDWLSLIRTSWYWYNDMKLYIIRPGQH